MSLRKLIDKITFWKLVFAGIMVAGLYSTYVRFFHGLGSATNLSDAFPWGLWIGFDVMVGVGLAAGGFVIAATVHIFHIEKYEHIARPTILTAFLGYQLVVLALLFDIGHPYRLWHPLIMWNPHSVMFEVAWCVTLYSIVLALEFSPLIFERLGMKLPLKIIRAIWVPVVIMGVLLSTLHQSSLGTLYVIAPDKLHALWYSPFLPVFFFISAIGAGLAMTICESFMSLRAFGKSLEKHLLEGIGRVIVVILAVYLMIRFQDLAHRGALPLAFMVTRESVMFWGEIGLGAIIPMILFAVPAIRRTKQGLFLASMLTVMGFIANRLNVAVTGMAAASGVNYMPSWMEFSVTLMIVAVGFWLFGLAVKHLPIFPDDKPEDLKPQANQLVFRGKTVLAFWGLLLIGFVLLSFSQMKSDKAEALLESKPNPTLENFIPDPEEEWPAVFAFPQLEDSPGVVNFSHETHVDLDEPNCRSCHETLFRYLEAGVPISGDVEDERIHEGDLCGSCHNGDDAFATDEDCAFCHQGEE